MKHSGSFKTWKLYTLALFFLPIFSSYGEIQSHELRNCSGPVCMDQQASCGPTGCSPLADMLYKTLELEQDFTSVFTILSGIIATQCQDFNELWHLFDVLQRSTIFVDVPGFSQTFTMLEQIIETGCQKFQETWTILSCYNTVGITSGGTISSPGVYCLINDITGTLTIAASAVQLDLNGKRISGGANNIVVSGQSDIKIRNGAISGASINGISVENCTNVKITDVQFEGNSNGLFVDTTNCIIVRNCNFSATVGGSLLLETSNNGEISNCKFFNNGGTPLIGYQASSASTVFRNIAMINNSSTNLTCFSAQSSASGRIENLLVSGNEASTGDFVGVEISACQDIFVQDAQLDTNRSLVGSCTIILANNSVVSLLKNLHISENRAGGAQGVFCGISDIAGDSSIIQDSIITDNISTFSTATGISFMQNISSLILKNLIKRNTGVTGGIGIGITDSFLTVAQGNTIESNTGGASASFGLQFIGSPVDSIIWSNNIVGHTNNFNIATIPLVLFARSTGAFTDTMTTSTRILDNVDIS
ncbi:MAG: right-handed parallel beta-helix repeat-containing protein [Candidatus Babeliales bacterium]